MPLKRTLSPHIPNAHFRETRSPSPLRCGKHLAPPEDLQPTATGSYLLTPDNASEEAVQVSERGSDGGDELSSGLAKGIKRIKGGVHSLAQYFAVVITSGESSRDFLARERTLFSWLKLAMLLSVASSTLYLRLQLKGLKAVFKAARVTKAGLLSQGGKSMEKEAKSKRPSKYELALKRKARRDVLPRKKHATTTIPTHLSSGNAGPDPSIWSVSQLDLLQDGQIYNSTKFTSTLDIDVHLSQGLGVIFFLLALVSLIVGYIDYMRTERALEHADEVLPFPKSESHRGIWRSASATGSGAATPAIRRESADRDVERNRIEEEAIEQPTLAKNDPSGRMGLHPQTSSGVQIHREESWENRNPLEQTTRPQTVSARWHDARHATLAHSGNVVRLTELVVAVIVFVTALLILALSGKS